MLDEGLWLSFGMQRRVKITTYVTVPSNRNPDDQEENFKFSCVYKQAQKKAPLLFYWNITVIKRTCPEVLNRTSSRDVVS